MYLLAACSVSWLCLISAFVTAWVRLPTPRSTTDLIVIIVVGTAAVLSSRIGAASLLTLLIRLLPHGRLRTFAAQSALRIVPTVLRSSVLAAASASFAVHAAQASPLPTGAVSSEVPSASIQTMTAALDPAWPAALSADSPPDPGWPTGPPKSRAKTPPAVPPSPAASPDSPDAEPALPPPEHRSPHGAGSPTGHAPGTSGSEGSEIHIVASGESLWSIALEQSAVGGSTEDIVDDIYSDNREVIGADPNLIMPGQRLEIQP